MIRLILKDIASLCCMTITVCASVVLAGAFTGAVP